MNPKLKCQMDVISHAGENLFWRLKEKDLGDAVVVAVSLRGMLIAAPLANMLGLPLEVLPAHVICHPADLMRSIGSVTIDAIDVEQSVHDIPKDYIMHQVRQMQKSSRNDYAFFYERTRSSSFRYKTVILVDDVVSSKHSIAACFDSVVRQMPLCIVVAARLMTAESVRSISDVADHVIAAEVISDYEIRARYRDCGDVDRQYLKSVFERFSRRHEVAVTSHTPDEFGRADKKKMHSIFREV